jgi:hypothetical protein
VQWLRQHGHHDMADTLATSGSAWKESVGHRRSAGKSHSRRRSLAGGARVEAEFDEQIVIRRYLETVEQIRQGRGR